MLEVWSYAPVSQAGFGAFRCKLSSAVCELFFKFNLDNYNSRHVSLYRSQRWVRFTKGPRRVLFRLLGCHHPDNLDKTTDITHTHSLTAITTFTHPHSLPNPRYAIHLFTIIRFSTTLHLDVSFCFLLNAFCYVNTPSDDAHTYTSTVQALVVREFHRQNAYDL